MSNIGVLIINKEWQVVAEPEIKERFLALVEKRFKKFENWTDRLCPCLGYLLTLEGTEVVFDETMNQFGPVGATTIKSPDLCYHTAIVKNHQLW